MSSKNFDKLVGKKGRERRERDLIVLEERDVNIIVTTLTVTVVIL